MGTDRPGSTVAAATPRGLTEGSARNIRQDWCAGKPPTKQSRVLRCLLQRSHTSFELEREAHDHCPNSTVSELKKHGLVIVSEMVQVPGYGGALARIAKYTLAEESRPRAMKLLQTGR